MKARLSHARLMSVLSYEAETGVFSWLERTNRRILIGATAGSLNGYGYLSIRIDGDRYPAHRLAWLYMNGKWPDGEIDHINGVRHDNRIVNLRDCTSAQNRQNQRKGHRRSSSGLLGASWNARLGRWVSQITVNGEHRYLGLFDTAEGAHAQYVQAKREIHPFGRL